MSLFGRSFSVFSPGARGVPFAPQPIIIAAGSGVLYAEKFITHAMQIAGGNFQIVPAIAGFYYQVIYWDIQKPTTWAAGYAPTNTTFNLRLGSLATNIATGITPVVTNTTGRLDSAIGVGVANLGAGVFANVVNQPLNINCGAGNGGGNANNLPMLATVWYIRIRVTVS